MLERVWKVGGGRRAFFPHVFGVVLSMFFQQWHFTSAAEVGSFWLPTSFHTPRISLIVLTWRHHSTRAVLSSQQTVLARGALCRSSSALPVAASGTLSLTLSCMGSSSMYLKHSNSEAVGWTPTPQAFSFQHQCYDNSRPLPFVLWVLGVVTASCNN